MFASVVNECQLPHLNDCHQNANCTDLEDGYECKCREGFEDRSPGRPGRVCQQKVNECENPALNSCDPNADCIDEPQGYKCKCRAGFFDVSPSPNLQGRGCRQSIPVTPPFKHNTLIISFSCQRMQQT